MDAPFIPPATEHAPASGKSFPPDRDAPDDADAEAEISPTPRFEPATFGSVAREKGDLGEGVHPPGEEPGEDGGDASRLNPPPNRPVPESFQSDEPADRTGDIPARVVPVPVPVPNFPVPVTVPIPVPDHIPARPRMCLVAASMRALADSNKRSVRSREFCREGLETDDGPRSSPRSRWTRGRTSGDDRPGPERRSPSGLGDEYASTSRRRLFAGSSERLAGVPNRAPGKRSPPPPTPPPTAPMGTSFGALRVNEASHSGRAGGAATEVASEREVMGATRVAAAFAVAPESEPFRANDGARTPWRCATRGPGPAPARAGRVEPREESTARARCELPRPTTPVKAPTRGAVSTLTATVGAEARSRWSFRPGVPPKAASGAPLAPLAPAA